MTHEDSRFKDIVTCLLKILFKSPDHIQRVLDHFTDLYSKLDPILKDKHTALSVLKIQEFIGNLNFLMNKYWIIKETSYTTFECELKYLLYDFGRDNSSNDDYDYLRAHDHEVDNLLHLEPDQLQQVLSNLSLYVTNWKSLLMLCNQGNPDSVHYIVRKSDIQQCASATSDIEAAYVLSGCQVFTNFPGIIDLHEYTHEIYDKFRELNLTEYYKGLYLGYDKYFHFTTGNITDIYGNKSYTWSVWRTCQEDPIIIGDNVKTFTDTIAKYELISNYSKTYRTYEDTIEIMAKLGTKFGDDGHSVLKTYDTGLNRDLSVIKVTHLDGSFQCKWISKVSNMKSGPDSFDVFDVTSQTWIHIPPSKGNAIPIVNKKYVCSGRRNERSQSVTDHLQLVDLYDHLISL